MLDQIWERLPLLRSLFLFSGGLVAGWIALSIPAFLLLRGIQSLQARYKQRLESRPGLSPEPQAQIARPAHHPLEHLIDQQRVLWRREQLAFASDFDSIRRELLVLSKEVRTQFDGVSGLLSTAAGSTLRIPTLPEVSPDHEIPFASGRLAVSQLTLFIMTPLLLAILVFNTFMLSRILGEVLDFASASSPASIAMAFIFTALEAALGIAFSSHYATEPPTGARRLTVWAIVIPAIAICLAAFEAAMYYLVGSRIDVQQPAGSPVNYPTVFGVFGFGLVSALFVLGHSVAEHSREVARGTAMRSLPARLQRIRSALHEVRSACSDAKIAFDKLSSTSIVALKTQCGDLSDRVEALVNRIESRNRVAPDWANAVREELKDADRRGHEGRLLLWTWITLAAAVLLVLFDYASLDRGVADGRVMLYGMALAHALILAVAGMLLRPQYVKLSEPGVGRILFDGGSILRVLGGVIAAAVALLPVYSMLAPRSGGGIDPLGITAVALGALLVACGWQLSFYMSTVSSDTKSLQGFVGAIARTATRAVSVVFQALLTAVLWILELLSQPILLVTRRFQSRAS